MDRQGRPKDILGEEYEEVKRRARKAMGEQQKLMKSTVIQRQLTNQCDEDTVLILRLH